MRPTLAYRLVPYMMVAGLLFSSRATGQECEAPTQEEDLHTGISLTLEGCGYCPDVGDDDDDSADEGDNTAPSVVEVQLPASEVDPGQDLVIGAVVSDESGVARVQLRWWNESEQEVDAPDEDMDAAVGVDSWEITIPAVDVVTGELFMRLTAEDQFGNGVTFPVPADPALSITVR